MYLVKLKTPAIWTKPGLNTLLDICGCSEHDVTIDEVYGAVPILRSGRPRNDLKGLTLVMAKKFFAYCKSIKIKTNYLFNSKYADEDFSKEFINNLQKIIETVEPDILTISSIKLIRIIHGLYPHMPINISTVYGLKSAAQLKKILDLKEKGIKIESLCLHHDCTVDRDLKNLIEYINQTGLKFSILVNENCEYQCPYRSAHYKLWNNRDRSDLFDAYLWSCVTNIIKSPEKLVGLAGMIRPEDIAFYSELGIREFKIAGRNKPVDWLIKVVSAYANQRYTGNLLDLLVFTIPPGISAPDLFFVQNDKVRPIRERWKYSPTESDRLEGTRLFQKGYLNVRDKQSRYTITEGKVTVKQPGQYLNSLMVAAQES